MSLFRSTLLVGSAAAVLTGSRFVLAAVLARRLGVEDFGLFAYAQWLADIAFLVCSLGTTGVAARYFAEYQGNPEKLLALRKVWGPWAIACTLVSAFAACGGALVSGLNMGAPELALLGVWTVSAGAWAMNYAVTMAKQRFSAVFMASLTFALIVVVGSILLSLDLRTALVLMIVAHVMSTLILSVSQSEANEDATKPAYLDLRAIRRYAANIWITALLWGLVWSRGEYPVVRAVVGDAGLATYAVGTILFGAAVQAVMLWVGAVAPELTRLLGEGSKDRAIEIARRFSDLQLLISAVLAVALATFSRPLVQTVFGANYSDASDVLTILAPGLIGFAVAAQNHLLQMTTNARFNRDASLVGLAMLYGLALFLTPRFGLEGGASARLIALLSMMGLSLWKSRCLLGHNAVSLVNFIAAVTAALFVVTIELGMKLDIAWSVVLASTVTVTLLLVLRDENGRPLALRLFRSASALRPRS